MRLPHMLVTSFTMSIGFMGIFGLAMARNESSPKNGDSLLLNCYTGMNMIYPQRGADKASRTIASFGATELTDKTRAKITDDLTARLNGLHDHFTKDNSQPLSKYRDVLRACELVPSSVGTLAASVNAHLAQSDGPGAPATPPVFSPVNYTPPAGSHRF